MGDSNFSDTEAMAALLRLEAKQVLRGFESEIFPGMTTKMANRIRSLTPEKLVELMEQSRGCEE